ncbi:hypothetical protein D9619_002882 [Psilocybe cf. subviscida]|uniref:Uncharacterized protein n=1 Tax=Psilocybe cf. subviscida TaxID=2480587 RepID=A0A8H5ETS1_9AGAR|nr:hypothetical protein D9619_002882 [Psilocybe cf. subviscida]
MATSAIQIAPATSTTRGDVVLQPNYFTSSVYVKALRDDISTLVVRYHEAYSQAGMKQPFSQFKNVWKALGWTWLHFKVFDSRSRQTFLEVTVRLFLERTVKTEAPFTRAVALFGMYTFFYSQIKEGAPKLQFLTNIPIPYDQYATLMDMADSLSAPASAPLQPYVRYVLSCLRRDNVFLLLPKTDLAAMNPRELPREIYADDGIVFTDVEGKKRKGRPPKREKGKKARLALEGLDEHLSRPAISATADPAAAYLTDEYRALKTTVLQAVEANEDLPNDIIHSANREVLERMRELQGLMETSEPSTSEDAGAHRLEQVVEGMAGGSAGRGIFEFV